MKYSLLIDDIRDFHCHFTVRNQTAAIDFIRAVKCNIIEFDTIYLDFDLGDGTGLEVLKNIITYEVNFERIQLITMNPAGRKQLENYLTDFGFHRDEEGYWVK
jgi:response regulator of citrate/malate metabolism